MKLCTRIDGVRERLWDGSLTLDAAAQLQAAFERRDRERGRGAGTGSAMGSNGSARPAPARSAQRKPAPEPKPGPVLDVSVQKALVEQAAGKSTREVTKMLADVDPALAVPADRLRPLGEGRWELKAVIDADCHRGLEQLKGLLSHVDPHMTLGQLVGRLVNEGLDRHDPGRPPRRGRTRSAPAGADRPPAAKRKANSDGAAASATKRPARSGSTGASAPHTERGLERSSAVGSEAAGTAGRHPRFGAEVAPSGRSRHTGGGEARGLAARPRTLPLRRSTHRAPMRVTASAADRSRAPVRPGRRCAAGEPQIAVLRASPRPPYGADFTARAARVIVMDAPRNIVSRRSPRETRKIPPKSPNARRRHIKIVRASAGLHRPSRTRHSTIRKGAIHEFLDRRR